VVVGVLEANSKSIKLLIPEVEVDVDGWQLVSSTI